jgi:hypothetical protein
MRPHLALSAFGVLAASQAAAIDIDMPARKAGLWELKMTFEGRANLPVQTMQHCIDAETDKLMNSVGGAPSAETCSTRDIQKIGSTITIDSVCKAGGATITSHGVVSGDFNSAYTVKMASKREGGPAISGRPATGDTSMTLEAKWLGACKLDQKPGDIIMAGGRKTNILHLKAMQKGTGRPPGAMQKK